MKKLILACLALVIPSVISAGVMKDIDIKVREEVEIELAEKGIVVLDFIKMGFEEVKGCDVAVKSEVFVRHQEDLITCTTCLTKSPKARRSFDVKSNSCM